MKNNQAATIYAEALAALERKASLEDPALARLVGSARRHRQCRQLRPHDQHARGGARQSRGRQGRSCAWGFVRGAQPVHERESLALCGTGRERRSGYHQLGNLGGECSPRVIE